MPAADTPSYLPSENPRIPVAQHPFRHFLPVQIRFSDIDMLGHLNNNVYLSFMDLAKLDYFQTIAGTQMRLTDIRLVVVHIDCDFLMPAYFTDQLQVWTAITHIGDRSLTIEQRIIDAPSGQIKCIGRTIMAGFDPATASGATLDQRWVDAAIAFEQHPLTQAK